MQILRQYEEDGLLVTEYTKDGTTVSHTVRVPIQTESIEPVEPTEPQPTLEEVAEATLLETQYQTLLIEMLAGF